METTTTKTKKAGKETMPALKKVSATQIKLSDKPVGFEIEGNFVGMTEHEVLDQEGELKKRYQVIIEQDGERTKFLADAGFRTALADAMIEKGEWFKAVKGPKVSLGGAKTMNTWDIFVEAIGPRAEQ